VHFRRQFTVMILPDAQGQMRRIRIRSTHLVGGLAAALLLVGLAMAAPMLGVWSGRLSSQLADVTEERDRLATRSQEIESTLVEMRRRLDQFERRTEKMASLAGLDMPSLATPALGQPVGIASLNPALQAEVLRSEAEDLAERGELLERRIDVVERALAARSERLARIPSVLPVAGLVGGGFGWRRDPFTGSREFHRGVDVSAPTGSPVAAPADGIVLSTGRESGYGNVLVLGHGDGTVTRFGHLYKFEVKPGQSVRRGDVIARVGNTGRSTGPHLHYEVMLEGGQVDPMGYILDEGAGF